MKNILNYAIVVLTLIVSSLAGQAFAGETVTYFHLNNLNSPVAATDESGAIKWREQYQPYGDRILKEGDSDNSIWFTGKPEEVGLTYMGARWYDPELGRFLEIDPVGFHLENTQSFNRYAYANNNPFRFIDPNGETAFDIGFLLVDVAKLGGAIYSGVGVGAALADVVISAVGVASPIPGTGLYLKATIVAKNAEKVLETAKVTKRPGSFRKKTLKDSWDNAADGSKPGSKQCPDCKKNVFGNPHKNEKRNGPDGWDNDHQPKWKDRDLSGMDRKQVLDEYNKDTRVRCPSCNRSDNQ